MENKNKVSEGWSENNRRNVCKQIIWYNPKERKVVRVLIYILGGIS